MMPNDIPEETKWVIDNIIRYSFVKLEILDFINANSFIPLAKDTLQQKITRNSFEKDEFETAISDFVQSGILIKDSDTSTYKLTEDISFRNKLKQFFEYKTGATYNCLKILCRMLQYKDTNTTSENLSTFKEE
ncbi:MAG: hypothetical protein AABY84_11155 [Candidatus Firestonebacteria bacterium]